MRIRISNDRGGHVMFTVTAIGIILLPGLTITAARVGLRNSAKLEMIFEFRIIFFAADVATWK